MATVFLTGATGLVGRAVAKALVAAGDRVHGLCRGADAASELSALGIEPVVSDLRRTEDVLSGLPAVDASKVPLSLRRLRTPP